VTKGWSRSITADHIGRHQHFESRNWLQGRSGVICGRLDGHAAKLDVALGHVLSYHSATMTAEEYQETVARIQQVFKTRRREALEQLEAEQEKDILALIRVWKLQHDEPPPPLVARRSKSPAATNGDQPVSQKQRIRRIIHGLPGPLDSVKVVRRFGEVFPDENQPESSTVSKVFRELVKEGKLKCSKLAGFQQPAQYVKT
jgi:hypothetical protein